MSFGRYSYLVYMLIFTLLPIGILWIRHFALLRKNAKIISLVTAFGALYHFPTYVLAERWGNWFFSDDRVLGLQVLGSPIEDLLFAVLISIAISSAVLVFIHRRQYGMLPFRHKR